MAEQGFEYIPYVPASPSVPVPGPFALDKNTVYTHGYGFTERFAVHVEAAANDPNNSIIDGLDPDHRQAYFTARFGAEPGLADEQGHPGSAGGCETEASEEFMGQVLVYGEFLSMVGDMWLRMLADPRVIEANRQWSRCVAEAGFVFADQEDAREYILAKVSVLSSRNSADPAIQQLKEEEVAVAAADYTCQQETIRLLEKVSREYEDRFRSDNVEIVEQVVEIARGNQG